MFLYSNPSWAKSISMNAMIIILLSRPSGIEPLADPLCGQLFRMQDQRGRMAFHSKSKGSVFPTVRC